MWCITQGCCPAHPCYLTIYNPHPGQGRAVMRARARLLIFSNEWKEEPGLSVRVHCARCYTNYVRSVGKQINSRTYTHVQLNLASILRENLRPLEQSRKIFTTKDHYGCSGRSVSCEVPPQPSSPLSLSTQLH